LQNYTALWSFAKVMSLALREGKLFSL